MKKTYTVESREAAWNLVNKIFPTDYAEDGRRTEAAGYPVYSSTAEGHFYYYICDLNTRLEVNTPAGTTNVWIETFREKMERLNAEITARTGIEARLV